MVLNDECGVLYTKVAVVTVRDTGGACNGRQQNNI